MPGPVPHGGPQQGPERMHARQNVCAGGGSNQYAIRPHERLSSGNLLLSRYNYVTSLRLRLPRGGTIVKNPAARTAPKTPSNYKTIRAGSVIAPPDAPVWLSPRTFSILQSSIAK